MIPLLNKYQRLLAWFISGVVVALLLSLIAPNQQPAAAANQIYTPSSTQPSATAYSNTDFANTHLEPNFYQ
ncbi:hypothetical protein NIES4074_37910 [Cylindrospermum sp. NIES-4074]|nr:hypothetical protein NIES4074_37910 [Cylindrospermum sp. NIES-4074]